MDDIIERLLSDPHVPFEEIQKLTVEQLEELLRRQELREREYLESFHALIGDLSVEEATTLILLDREKTSGTLDTINITYVDRGALSQKYNMDESTITAICIESINAIKRERGLAKYAAARNKENV